jgi:GNAT superfamily N-acetyltransferase
MWPVRFLKPKEFAQYGQWLKAMDEDTRALYFGVAVTDEFIDNLMERILAKPEQHQFLVAYRYKQWYGALHLAQISDTAIEFGISVDPEHRGQGIASVLMDEAIIWVRNRGFETLYLHCLSRNAAMKHLCKKHRLEMREDHGDADVATRLPPPSVITMGCEIFNTNRNIFMMAVQQAFSPFDELYG